MPPAKKKVKPVEVARPVTTASASPPDSAAPVKAMAGAPERKVRYAGLLVRFGAALIDGVLLFVALIALWFPGQLFFHSGLISALGFVVWLIGHWLYFLIADYRFGKTIGKHFLGLRVVDKEMATPLTLSTAAVREILGRMIIDGFTLGVGDLLIIFDSRKQALHDKIAGTFVVHEKDSEITIRK